MGAGASAKLSDASGEEITTFFKSLDQDSRAKIEAALAQHGAGAAAAAKEGGTATVYAGDVKGDADESGLTIGNYDKPDKTMKLGEGSATMEASIVDLGSAKSMRIVMQPGASWENCAKPFLDPDGSKGIKTCPARHVGMMESGNMRVKAFDGTEQILSAGDLYVIEPGHLVWNVGKEPVVMVEFESKIGEAAQKAGGALYAGDMEGKEKKALELNTFEKPTKEMDMPNGQLCVCMFGTAKAMRGRLQPGWTWQTGARTLLPEAMKDRTSCPARHVGIVTKGTFHVKMVDTNGFERDIKAGECYVCEPGHDVWVSGDEPVEFVEFESVL